MKNKGEIAKADFHSMGHKVKLLGRMKKHKQERCSGGSKHIWWNSRTGLCNTCGQPHIDAIRVTL